MHTSIRRRDALSALFVASAAVAALVPNAHAGAVGTLSAPMLQGGSRKHLPSASIDQHLWDKLVADLSAAKVAVEEFDERMLDPLIAKLDHAAPYSPLWFEITARSGAVARYHLTPGALDLYDDNISPVFRSEAAACRERYLARSEMSERLGVNAAWDEHHRLAGLEASIEDALMKMPAPSTQALWWKLDRLFGPAARSVDEDACGWDAAWINPVMADAERLLRV